MTGQFRLVTPGALGNKLKAHPETIQTKEIGSTIAANTMAGADDVCGEFPTP
jgi:hypothetical protein